MKKHVIGLVAAISALAASAATEIDLTDGWTATQVPVKAAKDKTAVIPRPDAASKDWKTGVAMKGKPVQNLKSEKKGDNRKAANNAWYVKSVAIPADWAKKSVVFDMQLNCIDCVVFVNGEKAGVMLHPYAPLELSPFLKPGADNEIAVFVTNQARGTGENDAFAYYGRDDYAKNRDTFASKPKLIARTPVWVSDVFVKPSTRKGRIDFECEIESLGSGKVALEAVIYEDAGRDEKTGELLGKKVAKKITGTAAVKKGKTVVTFGGEWKDAVTWELERPFLYNAEIRLVVGKNVCDSVPKILFGFRELWREGKDLYMNGHIQHYRGFWKQRLPKNLADVKKYGYSLAYQTHQHESRYTEDPKFMEECSRIGLAVFTGAPTVAAMRERMFGNDDNVAQYRRHLDFWAKSCRNYPAIAGASVCVNMLCAAWWMEGPKDFGQHEVTLDGDKGLSHTALVAMNMAREYNPYAFYFAHGDGNIGDIGNCNFYFNFIPLQEREEWLSSWAERGKISCYPAEFGEPYYACWFAQHLPEPTEWAAVYFGEEAYRREPQRYLEACREFAKDCQRKHYGGWVKTKEDKRGELYQYTPMAWEINKLFTARVNRTWRAWGEGPGMMYLVGWDWNDDDPYLQVQRLYNGQLIGFLGGRPEFTDKKHAYRAGETVEKCLVYCWDGFGDKPVSAKWELKEKATGKVVTSGQQSVTLKQSDTLKEPFSFVAPSVAKRTDYTLSVEFDAPGFDPTAKTDSFDLEVYPTTPVTVAAPAGKIALFDPRGETEAALKALGVACTKVADFDALVASDASYLVIGRRALDGLDPATETVKLAKLVRSGRRVLVASQRADVWQAMGLEVEDSMPRQLYNVSLEGIDDRELSFWDGRPMQLRDGSDWGWGDGYGFVQKNHKGSRGWRWTHNHAVAGIVFKIPETYGFRPLVRGEFDHAYSPLLKFSSGKGAAYFCSFDFEGRVGAKGCPAATAVAKSVWTEFFNGKTGSAGGAFYCGEEGGVFANDELRLGAKEWKPGTSVGNGVLVVGPDAKVSYADVKKAVAKGGHALVLGNAAFAASAGLAGTETKLYRYDEKLGSKFPFAGVGLALLRYRDGVPAQKFAAAKGWTVSSEGSLAVSDDGAVLVDSAWPFGLQREYDEAKDSASARSLKQSSDNYKRRQALVLSNWGVTPNDELLDRVFFMMPSFSYEFVTEPWNVCGPWPVEQQDSELMVNTVFDAKVEEQCLTGKIDLKAKYGAAGFDWTRTIVADKKGKVDLATLPENKACKFGTTYLITKVNRSKGGIGMLRFGLEWRGRVWVNGKEALTTLKGPNKPDGIVVPVEFKAGENVIAVKHGNGKNGKYFYLSLSGDGESITAKVRDEMVEMKEKRLYTPSNSGFDPYQYIYW